MNLIFKDLLYHNIHSLILKENMLPHLTSLYLTIKITNETIQV